MNSSSPPPIDPNLLDARIKPLVPQKAKDTPSSGNGTRTSTAPVSQQQSQTKKPKAYHNTATRSNSPLSTSTKQKPSSPETTKASEGKTPASMGDQKQPRLEGSEKKTDNSKQESNSRFGLAFIIILAVACIGAVGYSIGRASVEKDYRDRLANASRSISNLSNELASTTTALADTKQQLECQGRKWSEYRVSTSNAINELRARLRQEEEADPFRLQTSSSSSSNWSSLESDDSPTLIVKASVPGQTSVSATMDWNGRTARLPARVRNLKYGQQLSSRKVSSSIGGTEYIGEMPTMTVDWTGEKTVTVQLSRSSNKTSPSFNGKEVPNASETELSRVMRRSDKEVREQERRIFGRELGKEQKTEKSFWSHLWPF